MEQNPDFIAMQVYCVQTKAVQLYHVTSEQCYVAPVGAQQFI